MTAFSIRGVLLCVTAIMAVCAAPLPVQGQGPSSGTSPTFLRLVMGRALSQGKTARPESAAVGVPAAGPPVLAAAAAPVKSAVARLASIRPGATRSFLARQLQFPRVRRAYESGAERVVAMFAEEGVSEPELFFRVFKREQVLEVWARNRGGAGFDLLSTYPVCKLSGRLGPKRRQGDLQIPEGFYEIDLLNPQSAYHLSMRVDYPNPVDRVRGSAERLGGDIYIHGGCATIGCVPVTDRWIEEIYLLVVHARDAGQETIPVHIFPTRLDTGGLAWLATTYGSRFVDYPFWQNLQEGYLAFERTRTVPRVSYDGPRYTFSLPAGPLAPAAVSPSADSASPLVAASRDSASAVASVPGG